MIKYIQIFLFASMCISGLIAQNDLKAFRVHSFNDLNLRSEPSVEGSILARLPYDTKVQILEWEVNRPEKDKSSLRNNENVFWAKVKAGSNVGYVVDRYFSAPSFPIEKIMEYVMHEVPEGVNEDFLLMEPYQNCNTNFVYRPGLNWYIIQVSDKIITTKKIDPFDLVTIDYKGEELGGSFLGYKEKFEYVIASRIKLPEYKQNVHRKPRSNELNQLPEVVNEEGVKGLCLDNIFHPISRKHEFLRIFLKTDIDGDKKPDYILF